MAYKMGGMRRNSGHLVVLTEDDFEALVPTQSESWQGYTYKMTYETWDQDALEAGDTDDKGWVEEGSGRYDSLQDVMRAARDHNWLEWSSSPPDGRSWIVGEDEEDYRSGDRTRHDLWIERGDKQPLSDEEMAFITKGYGLHGMRRNNGHRRNTSFDLKKYGAQMQQWHTGMDAIYAVGSFASDGKVHPDPATIERAQSLLEGYSHSSKHSARDQREAKLLAQQTAQLAATHPRATGERFVADDPDALDSFTHGYLTAALFSTNDESDDSGGNPLDDNYGIADFAPEALEKAQRDCARFQSENAKDLEGFDEAEAGGDFWFTRCGHGVGFWDGDYPEPQAARLTKACKKFGEVWLTVGDDGLIYST